MCHRLLLFQVAKTWKLMLMYPNLSVVHDVQLHYQYMFLSVSKEVFFRIAQFIWPHCCVHVKEKPTSLQSLKSYKNTNSRSFSQFIVTLILFHMAKILTVYRYWVQIDTVRVYILYYTSCDCTILLVLTIYFLAVSNFQIFDANCNCGHILSKHWFLF